MTENEINVPFTILGGGLSGLFAAESLSKTSVQFLLIESSKATMGGLASLGGMKVGLLPAGSATANHLGVNKYALYTEKFIQRYKSHFSEHIQTENYTPNGYFKKKNYSSFLIEYTNVKSLVHAIRDKIKEKTVFAKICSIKMKGPQYRIRLNNGITIISDKLIVASGRCYDTKLLLEKLGQNYHDKNQIMLGCRGTFDPTYTAIKLFNNQVDFKVKAQNGFQNYCFNYKGYLHILRYMGRKYFSGSLDFKSKYGNTFIGKKIIVENANFLDFCPFSKNLTINDLNNLTFSMDGGQNYKAELLEFIEQFSINYNIRFKEFFFPALEQFWPAPKLKQNSLESSNIPNIFFIGDASGLSFGVLQCFITANILIDEMGSENGIH